MSLDYVFTAPSEKGAIIILPEGAAAEDLLNLRSITEEAQTNGESWYRYAYGERGRTAINNDSLFLITGFDKASSWAIAAFSDADRSAGLQGRFTAGNVFNGDVAGAYTWQAPKSVYCRVGPKAEYDANKRNQSISIRGFKIVLRKSFFDSIFSRHPVKVEVSRELPGIGSKSSAYIPRPISSGNGTQGTGKSQRQFPWVASSRHKELPGKPWHSSRTLVDAKCHSNSGPGGECLVSGCTAILS
jgi:hypothetical protein